VELTRPPAPAAHSPIRAAPCPPPTPSPPPHPARPPQTPKEWSYFPAPGAPAAPHAADESGRAGPVDRSEIRSLLVSGAVGWDTPFQAPGMPQPQPLRAIRELRWSLAPGPGLLSPFEAAGVALDALRQLAALQPATDARGAPLQPPPRAHVALASPDCLPHIAQVRA
jgi:DnaJ family protein C protein 13